MSGRRKRSEEKQERKGESNEKSVDRYKRRRERQKVKGREVKTYSNRIRNVAGAEIKLILHKTLRAYEKTEIVR